MAHFQLIDPDNPTSMVGKISKQGPGSFYVKPVSKNESNVPITGKAIVDIMGKKANISLIHRNREGDDPEPSVYKWSYFNELYSDYDPESLNPLTPVPSSIKKTIQSCYVFATAGLTSYTGTPSNINANTYIKLSEAFTTDLDAKNRAPSSGISYSDWYEYMHLCDFKMFYKQPTIDPDTGDIIVPVDDDTPANNRLRLPCNVDVSNVPSWITNVRVRFNIVTYLASNPSISNITIYDTWSEFRSAWEVVRANTADYSDVDFYYTLLGKIETNLYTSEIRPSSPNTITIQEMAGDSSKVWGAKPLYLYIGQLGGYKKIKLYYKEATNVEVTVPGPDEVSPGTAQISNHNLWLQGEPCNVIHDELGLDIITLSGINTLPNGLINGRAVANSTNQDHLDLDYSDDSKDREEYFYIGKPFFLGFVEETNLYKDNVGINLWDGRNTRDFWHNLYFTGVDEKCTYDPAWNNVGEIPHLYQGIPTDIKNIGYTILFPWAVKSGNSWKSLVEIPTAYTDEGLSTNSHRILAINWIDKAANGNPSINKDTVKSTSDILYGGGVSISSVNNRDKTNGEGWNFNPNKVNTGSGQDRLKNYLEYIAQQWDNNPTAFGSPADLRNVKEILFVPMFVTGHKMCPDNQINGSLINSMCYGGSLIPDDYKDHEGYAPYIGIFPPRITGWY